MQIQSTSRVRSPFQSNKLVYCSGRVDHSVSVSFHPGRSWYEHYYSKMGKEPFSKFFQQRQSQIDNRFILQGILGAGAFGTVQRAYDKQVQKVVAVKVISVDRTARNDERLESAGQEFYALRTLSHENIIRFIDCMNSRTAVYIVMEMMHCNLRKYITDNAVAAGGGLCSWKSRLFLEQLLKALEYCHQMDIMHRDVKTHNCLVGADGDLRLLDFGTCQKINEKHRFKTYICTTSYKAPEMILQSTYYNEKVDVWGAGCIMVEMLTGKRLFQDLEENKVLLKQFEFFGVPTEETWSYVSNLRGFPKPMPALKQALPPYVTIPFCCKNVAAANLLEGILELNPEDRMTAKKALEHPFFFQKCKLKFL